MSRATELLEQATPLPWYQTEEFIPADAALVVYAVNRLPGYEAAVDALEALMATVYERIRPHDQHYDAFGTAMDEADVALSRLRDKVPS